jgi:hypothetical protein
MRRMLNGGWSIALVAAGFTAWSAIFLLIYGMQAVGCRLAWDNVELFGAVSLQRLLQIVLYLAALAGTTALYIWLRDSPHIAARQPTSAFLKEVSDLGALAALGAVAFCFWGVFWLTAC